MRKPDLRQKPERERGCDMIIRPPSFTVGFQYSGIFPVLAAYC